MNNSILIHLPEWAERLYLGAPIRKTSIADLSLSLWHKWEPERVFVILTVYIDESGTHDSSELMIMGGYVARLGQWHEFDKKWKKLLKKNSLTHFHGKDFRHGNAEFKGWLEDKNKKFIKDATKIAEKNLLFGFSMRVNADDYQEYKNGEKPKKFPIETMYAVALKSCISFLTIALPDIGYDDITMNLILEKGHKHAVDATHLFNRVKKVDRSGTSDFLGTISFGEKKKYPGLQIADAIAYNAYQYESREAQITLNPPPEDTKIKNMKCPLYRLHADKDVLNEFKSNMLKIEEEQRQWGKNRTKAAV